MPVDRRALLSLGYGVLEFLTKQALSHVVQRMMKLSMQLQCLTRGCCIQTEPPVRRQPNFALFQQHNFDNARNVTKDVHGFDDI